MSTVEKEPSTDRPPVRTFDPDVLRRKYREERDKRLRPDGSDQYIEVVGEVVGGGFGGLLAGARLREAGSRTSG